MPTAPPLALADLVDDDERLFRLHTRLYTDPDVFDAEMRHIFSKTWVYVAHESEIPLPGDYKTTTIGRQPVIISRHSDGGIHVLFNRCRHRGTVVCRDELGHSNYFRCPYHNWVYGNDGCLVGMAMASGYSQDLDTSQLGLQRVPRVGTHRGLVFASLAASGHSLAEHLSGVARYIDAWLDRSPVGKIDVLATGHKYPYAGNWKWQAENGADGYHGNYVHESWQRLLQRAGEGAVSDVRKFRNDGCVRAFDYGHGLLERPAGENPASSWTGRMMAKYPEYAAALRANFDDEQITEIAARRNIFVFPNLYLFDTQIRHILPTSVDSTEVQLRVYALEGVPDALNEGRYRAHERFFGPAGFGSPDDLEIFVANQTGMKASGVDWALLSRGQHREVVTDGERVSHPTDETPTRSIYREWKRLIAAGTDDAASVNGLAAATAAGDLAGRGAAR